MVINEVIVLQVFIVTEDNIPIHANHLGLCSTCICDLVCIEYFSHINNLVSVFVLLVQLDVYVS